MEQQQRAELVHGPLNLVLRVGRVCGMAPVTFHSHGITLSKPLIILSFLFITFCILTELTGLMMDIMLTGTSDGYRSPTLLDTIIWLPDLGLNMVSGTYGVYGAPHRMKCVIKYMDLLEKIKVKLDLRGTEKSSNRRRRMFFTVYLTSLFILAAYDYYIFFIDGISESKELTIVYLYCGFYAQFSMWIILEMQYVMVALTINDLQRAFNAQLENMLDSVSTHGELVFERMIPAIRRLAITYNDIQCVVRQANHTHGPLLLILFMILIMDLTVTPYQLMVALLTGAESTVHAVLLVLWIGFFLINFAILIEPAHKTKEENDRTCALISSLSCRVWVSTPLSVELESFFEQLLLNRATYSLVGLGSVDRTLVATIFVTVSTYLVIVIQFHITQAAQKHNSNT